MDASDCDVDDESKTHMEENFEKIKDKIYLNMGLMGSVEDDVVTKIFHWFYLLCEVEIIENNMKTRIKVNQQMLEKWGITEEELYKIAMENSMRDLPAVLRTYRDSVYQENYNMLNGDTPITLDSTYVLENKDSYFSVGTLAYPGILDKIAEILDSDFYFYAKNPNCIFIMAQNGDYDGSLVNLPAHWDKPVSWLDAFSPIVYRYCRETGKIDW